MAILSRPLSVVAFAAAVAGGAAETANSTARSARPTMHYFRQWFDAKIAEDLRRDPAVGPWTAPPSQEQIAGMFTDPACLNGASTLDSELGPDGVHRAVVKLESGRLHFVASAGGKALVVDPPMLTCGGAVAASRRLGEPRQGERRLGERGLDAEELLHPIDDPLVQDCKDLFARESVLHCGAKFAAKPTSAVLEIVDGFEVRMLADIYRVSDTLTSAPAHAVHEIICLFEPKGTGLAGAEMRAASEQTPEEAEGMSATVIMHRSICTATSSLPQSTIGAMRLFEMHGGGGELSHVKGWRHVYDNVPKWVSEVQIKSIETMPKAVDLRNGNKGGFPNCFPGTNGNEVVRNQGACGSCWAFAAASTYSANVCIAGNGAEAVDVVKRRIEASVQRIISCNPDQYGCHGGHAQAAGASIAKHGAATDMKVQYQCGSGSSLDHFKVKSKTCDSFPWGGSGDACNADYKLPKWNFGGVFMIDGERDMMNAIYQGHTLYVSMTLHKNFMDHKRGVYTRMSGAKMGGHAMVAVGYGEEISGLKYWIVQNSWGKTWGQSGYIMIVRGENIGDIEKRAAHIAGWPEGATPPNIPPDQKMAMALNKMGIPVDVNSIKAGAAAVVLGAGAFILSIARCIMASGAKQKYAGVPH